MHQINLDLNLTEISKIEGGAALDLSIKNNQVTKCEFKITEYKRFYTQAIRGKSALAAPSLLARICGTCSNAHILAAIKAVENALEIHPSDQIQLLRQLIIDGLYIRDHALHLYLFVLPDLFNKDSLLDFDDNNPEQHQLVHDAFSVKEAGNQLSILIGGRSIHAPLPQVGGFNVFPQTDKINQVIQSLESIKPCVDRLIKIFTDCPWQQSQAMPYLALKNNQICSSDGLCIREADYRYCLNHLCLKYSQASAYTYKDQPYLTGALARLNLAEQPPRPFPSNNLYHNNLAQALEISHSIESALKILKSVKFSPEPLIKPKQSSGSGAGLIEAPRGILYHQLTIEKMIVKDAEILVPTGQNQLCIENDIRNLVNEKLAHTGSEKSPTPGVESNIHPRGERSSHLGGDLKSLLEHDIEILIRAYDPCMSCAAHFLKINWR